MVPLGPGRATRVRDSIRWCSIHHHSAADGHSKGLVGHAGGGAGDPGDRRCTGLWQAYSSWKRERQVAGRSIGVGGCVCVSLCHRRLGGSAPGNQRPNNLDVLRGRRGLAAFSSNVQWDSRAIQDGGCWSGPGRLSCLEYSEEPAETSLRFGSSGAGSCVESSVRKIGFAGLRRPQRRGDADLRNCDAGVAAGTHCSASNQAACKLRLDALELQAAVQQPGGYNAVCRSYPGRDRGIRPGRPEKSTWKSALRGYTATSREMGTVGPVWRRHSRVSPHWSRR
jgi:hypothetical protein